MVVRVMPLQGTAQEAAVIRPVAAPTNVIVTMRLQTVTHMATTPLPPTTQAPPRMKIAAQVGSFRKWPFDTVDFFTR